MCLVVAAAAAAWSACAQAQALPGRVRVKLQREVAQKVEAVPQARLQSLSQESGMTGVTALDATLTRVKAVKIRRAFPCSKEREAEHQKYGLDQWYEITFDESVNPQEAKRLLQSTAGVEKANTKRKMTMYETGRPRIVDPKAIAPKASTTMPFNDPKLSQQWHYNNDGSIAGAVAGADINLFKAWQLSTGSENVVVAVIDGGVDYTHEDLADACGPTRPSLTAPPGLTTTETATSTTSTASTSAPARAPSTPTITAPTWQAPSALSTTTARACAAWLVAMASTRA